MKQTPAPGVSGFSFNRLLDDFRQLDPNDPGVWPLAPKVVVLILIFLAALGAAYWFDWKDQLETLEKRGVEEIQLKEDWKSKKMQAINLDEYRKQLAEINRQFGALLKQLPSRSEMETLLVDINKAGKGRGLQFEYWKPGQESIKDFYAELPISITLTGSYHDFGQFAGDVAKLPRIVTLRDLSVGTKEKESVLKMDVTAMTYRYLDEEEVAKQKREKAAKDKDAKKK